METKKTQTIQKTRLKEDVKDLSIYRERIKTGFYNSRAVLDYTAGAILKELRKK
ncbi:MAG TPA: hypothetical protein VHO28_01785 [Ignavibacteriales bacterium]|jgi:hypothetical protein|nr:hypothetical protein [Ignavibacteriales bacterium]HEX3073804.1 hypothetical protein [Ignavibacteriales bacterium]